jgi:hypothetical protein
LCKKSSIPSAICEGANNQLEVKYGNGLFKVEIPDPATTVEDLSVDS